MKMLLCALLALGMSALAEETIITLRGEKFEKATVEAVNPACVKITHEGGIATVRFTDLPAEVQKKYGYDAEKEKAWRAATQTALRQAAIAGEERKAKAREVQQAQAEMQRQGLQATWAAFGDPSVDREGFVRRLKWQR